MKTDHRGTVRACFTAYIVQAIVNNFAPLLFVTFERDFDIPLSKITLLITVNFAVQLAVDLASAGFIDRLGLRFCVIAAHLCAAAGLVMLSVLPGLLPDPFTGLLAAVAVYALGGGLIEVLVSPIIEALPTGSKERSMSLLHSFYCWGQVGVVLVSTVFFAAFGVGAWRILGILWAAIPLANAAVFARVPLYSLSAPGGRGPGVGGLVRSGLFWVFFLMMLCAGAGELSVSQWASAFAERGLGVSKTVGDLMGPMAFAVLMGASRLLFGKYGERLDLSRYMKLSCVLCVGAYLCISLVPSPIAGLLGCAVCGFSVGIFWPGTLSHASASIKGGGTAMFALLALAGDLGCTAGPTLAGFVSGLFDNDLRAGILAAAVFPAVLLAAVMCLDRRRRPTGEK